MKKRGIPSFFSDSVVREKKKNTTDLQTYITFIKTSDLRTELGVEADISEREKKTSLKTLNYSLDTLQRHFCRKEIWRHKGDGN